MSLCRNFCTYYKPGKNEELACQGFIVVQRLIARGRPVPPARPERVAAPDCTTIERMKERVCAFCDFRIDGCDFILTDGAAAPCGGVTLLAHLLVSGELQPEDL